LIKHIRIISRNTLGKFDWKTLMMFRGIIHFPYEASTMSIFEHLSSGIPLFFPTKRFMIELINAGVPTSSNYWRKFAKRSPPDYLSPTDRPDFWLDRADYYDFVGIYYFDSIPDLYQQLDSFVDIHYEKRMAYLADRKTKVLNKWSRVIADLTNGVD
jgi:hypothetical protein